jgi:hypothetical protein
MTVTNRTTFRSLLTGARNGLLAAGLLLGSAAQAAPLNLTLNDFPDIVSSFIDVTYNAGTDAFTASGFAQELDDDGSMPAEAIAGGTFNLIATIDASGAMSGGSLSIGGTVSSLGFNTGTLLTGNLTDFGFPDAGGDPLEFLFDVTGGDAAVLYGGVGAVGGVIMGATGFGGSFDSDFDNLRDGAGSGVANVAPIPVPAAVWLFGSGLVGLAGLGRRRRLA